MLATTCNAERRMPARACGPERQPAQTLKIRRIAVRVT
jgi:hypothetical protein